MEREGRAIYQDLALKLMEYLDTNIFPIGIGRSKPCVIQQNLGESRRFGAWKVFLPADWGSKVPNRYIGQSYESMCRNSYGASGGTSALLPGLARQRTYPSILSQEVVFVKPMGTNPCFT